MNSTSPGTGRLLMFSSASFAACSAASEVEMQSSVSPHLSIIALHDHKVFVCTRVQQQKNNNGIKQFALTLESHCSYLQTPQPQDDFC